MFAWFGDRLLGLGERESGGCELVRGARAGGGRRLAPGASGLVALDWWNGNRTILGDADLSGVIAGLTLATDAGRDLPGATRIGGLRDAADHRELRRARHPLTEVVACGGIAERSALMMQLSPT